MNYEEAITRLELHAHIFFEDESLITSEQKESLDYLLFLAAFKRSQPDVESALDDIIKCLQVILLNLIPLKSETKIDKRIVRAIQTILYNLLYVEINLKKKGIIEDTNYELLKTHLIISSCWNEILSDEDEANLLVVADAMKRVLNTMLYK